MQPYNFLAALPALLALAGFVLYQMLGAHRAGDEVTRRIVEKLRRDAPAETPDRRLNAKQVEHLVGSQQNLARIVGEQDFRLLQQALRQQFLISALVYVISIAFCAWSVYLFVHQVPPLKDLRMEHIVLSDRETEAGGLAVDVDPLSVTWEAQGDREDVKVFLENVNTGGRTNPEAASSSETMIAFSPDAYHALLLQRQRGSSNRLRAVIQTRTSSFKSEPTDVMVGFVILTLADRTGVDVAAMIDNTRIAFYSFQAKVMIPAVDPAKRDLVIGPTIAYYFDKVGIDEPGSFDWSDVRAVYLGPDDRRLVRCQYLIDDSLKSSKSIGSSIPKPKAARRDPRSLPNLQITYPPVDHYAPVDLTTPVSVRFSNVPLSQHPWLVLRGQEGEVRYWPVGACDKDGHSLIESRPRRTLDGDWEGIVQIGSPDLSDRGQDFTLVLVVVDSAEDERLAKVHREGACLHNSDPRQDGTRIPLKAIATPLPVTRLVTRMK